MKNTIENYKNVDTNLQVDLYDERLEELSDKVRSGIPISIVEALEVIEYQRLLKEKKQKSIWDRIRYWFNS